MDLVLHHAAPPAEIASIDRYLQSAEYKAKHPDIVRADGSIKTYPGMRLSQVLMRREREEFVPFMVELEARGVQTAFYAYDGVVIAVKAGDCAGTIETIEELLAGWNTEDV